MKLLSNGCSRSEFSVTPSNWKSSKESMNRPWRITYRFYDSDKRVKQVPIKGMNHITDWEERKRYTIKLIESEINLVDVQGYNPIADAFQVPGENQNHFSIQPFTGLARALELAKDFIPGSPETIANIKSVLKYSTIAAKLLNIEMLQVNEIKRKHILQLLDKCKEVKKSFSNRNYNLYRATLMSLFKVMVKYQVIEYNPVDEYLEKKPEEIKLRTTLSKTQRHDLYKTLKERDYWYWNFINIFFHSGGRLRELFRIKVMDVDLSNQRYKATIRKGNRSREAWRPIKNIALPYWKELMDNSEPAHFVFAEGFRPGLKQHYFDRATKLWSKYVKEEMSIPVDLYSLKHLNLDEVAAELSLKDAQKLAEHTTPVITMKHYAQGEEERQMSKIKEVNNPLG